MPPAPLPHYIPSVRATYLAERLKELRVAAGLGQGEVAARLNWSRGKVGHIETARNKVSVEDVVLLLDVYGVTSPEREELTELAHQADRRGWWVDYADVLHGSYIPLEYEAKKIEHWAPQVVPGLLQTPEYAREVIRAGRPDAVGDVERRLQARMLRQTLLVRENPPHLHVVLDEAALGRLIGGEGVMRDQLYRLAAEARRSNVTIQILPQTAGAHAGLDGALIVLRFPDPYPEVAYVEGFHGAAYLEDPRRVGGCMLAFERLCASALSPQESSAVLDTAAKR